ncbi:MAG: RHS repeat-associated core domain-containing protein [Sphingobacteriales bacterium]|nr:MAG: RHS repeat-associated core domain-containing protein [Sphingobacteriales bacterium]
MWGYTGHEQLDAFGLVNMNARLYDPKLGRLLSVDNYVSDPASPLAYNRYTYALNNPISYVDPSGNHPLLVAMAIGAAISAASYTAQAAFTPGGLSRNFNIGDFASTTITGGVLGGVTYGIGSAFQGIAVTGVGMSFVKEAGRAAAHGLVGGVMSDANGGSFWVGFASGSAASFATSLVDMGQINLGKVGGAFFSMGVGAGSSYIGGGDPWMGAASGLMSYGLNKMMHPDGETWRTKNKKWDSNGNGKLEKSEADKRWLSGEGGEIYVDNSKINWEGLRIPEGFKIGDFFSIGTTEAFINLPWETASTYGGTTFKILSVYPIILEVQDQDYHYEMREVTSFENATRNFGTWWGHPGRQPGHYSIQRWGADFNIHYYNKTIFIR